MKPARGQNRPQRAGKEYIRLAVRLAVLGDLHGGPSAVIISVPGLHRRERLTPVTTDLRV